MTLLLDLGLPVDAPDAHRRETALFSAAREGNFQAVKVLLDRGADVNGHVCSENDDDDTYNHEREENNYDGADASFKTDRDEVTPLHMAVSSNSYHAAFTLLKHGCDLEVTNSLGRTANSMQN